MSWVVLALLAQLFWALGNVLDKYIFSKWLKDPRIALMFFGTVGALAAGAVSLVKNINPLPLPQLGWALLLGLAYAAANLLYYKALKTGEVSLVIALVYLNPLFTAALSAAVLGEFFSLPKYFGVVLSVLGAMLISYKGSWRISRAAVFCVASALLYSVYDVILKHLLGAADYWSVFVYARLATFVCVLPLIVFYSRPLREFLRGAGGVIAILSSNLLGITGIWFYTVAASLGYITLVTSLTALQPLTVLLFSLLLSVVWPAALEEKWSRKIFIQKFAAVILISAGAMLVAR